MSIRKISPYLNFDGKGEQAMKFYESVLGAKLEQLSRMGDVPDAKASPEDKSRLMHALLRFENGDAIMASDTMKGEAFSVGNNVHVTLDFTDIDEMAKKFEALAAGGKVNMPLNDAFWGARFGMLVDKFGIHWMFNCELKKG
jgi:PhnB protein